MSRIRIKNFGPIKDGFNTDDGFMDIKKVTVFIGDQGTGKSAVAKLISTLSWMEKSINRGDIKIEQIHYAKFSEFVRYYGLADYFVPNTEIEYEGDAISFKLGMPPVIKKHNKRYVTPKIMYVPAERNFLSTIQSAYNVTDLPRPLFTFGEELKKAQRELNDLELILPINNFRYEYDRGTDSSFVTGPNYRLNLLHASSGLQSSIPLYLVSRNLALNVGLDSNKNNVTLSLNQTARRNEEIAEIMLNRTINDDGKRVKLEEIYSKYHNACFINIVEEPEQNLFPASQRLLLNKLLEFANYNKGDKLVVTTHSPYIINYLSIAIQGDYLKNKMISASKIEFIDRLDKIVPQVSTISDGDVAVYQLQENGTINLLPNYEGIPSDKNSLNNSLAEGNELFDALLEIEQEL